MWEGNIFFRTTGLFVGVGSNIWVHKQLEIKLEELKAHVDLVNRMPFHPEP